MRAVQPVIASDWVPYLKNVIGRIAQHIRKGD